MCQYGISFFLRRYLYMGYPIRLWSAIAPFSVALPAFSLIFLRFLIANTVARATPTIPIVFLLTLGFIMYLFAVVRCTACVVAVIYYAGEHG